LDDPEDGSTGLVPNTNGLLVSPALQDWRSDGIHKFEILLIPTLPRVDGSSPSPHAARQPDKARCHLRANAHLPIAVEGIDRGHLFFAEFKIKMSAFSRALWVDRLGNDSDRAAEPA
jgi:hypothetical protein